MWVLNFILDYQTEVTCHRRGWNNLSFGFLEKSIFLIIEVELSHQKRLKREKRDCQYHCPKHSSLHKCKQPLFCVPSGLCSFHTILNTSWIINMQT